MKQCPYCSGELTEYAVKCVHCKKELEAMQSEKEFTIINENMPEEEIQYADFFSRLSAVMIDALLLFMVIFLPLLIVGFFLIASGAPAEMLSLIIVLCVWLYSAGMESSGKQATFGKMAMHIRVTDVNGDRISFRRASGRFWGKTLSALLLNIGYIIMFFTARRQTLHDLMSGCILTIRKD